MPAIQPRSGALPRRATLRVLATFELRDELGADSAPLLAADERRLLAALAVGSRPRTARELAGMLWPTLTLDLALGTLDGVRDSLGDLVTVTGPAWRLADEVRVDLADALERLRSWQRDPHGVAPSTLDELVELLSQDLLADMGEPWANQEREGFRRVRLHALEALCTQLTATGRHSAAIRAGALVVAAEPLRESARRNLIEAHLAAGNVSEAVQQYEAFVETCARVGLTPNLELTAFFPPSPAWPVLHVRRPIHAGAAVGRGLRLDAAPRRAVGAGAVTRG
jgi:DNA-binding SARP family transcriptional activator